MDQENKSIQKEETGKPRVMKRTIKDSVFTDLFGDYRYLLRLYKALHPEDMGNSSAQVCAFTALTV